MVTCEVTGSRRHSNDLLQGGLEIPCIIFKNIKLILESNTFQEIGRQLIKLIDLFDPHVMKNLYGEV